MKVYHGSYTEIVQVDLSKCKPFKDFGKGFYVTKYLQQAEFWAKRMGDDYDTEGVITEFDFNEYAYESEDLKVLHFDEYNEAWLDFVVYNRDKKNRMHEYDIVEGPVADDDITQRIFAYLAGNITKANFLNELKFKHEPSHQIAFCTLKALQMLDIKSRQSDIRLLDIDDYITQLLVKEKGMSEEKAIDTYFESKIYQRLIDENTKFYEKNWDEIYKLLLDELFNNI